MKSILKFFLFAVGGIMSLTSCGRKTPSSDVPEPFIPNTEGPFTGCEIYPVDFGVDKALVTKEEISEYMSGVDNDNRPVDNGVILSPYFSKMTVNGVEVPVFATRTTNTVHSFAYIDIQKEDASLSTKLEVIIEKSNLKKTFKTVEVLPLKSGITATIEDNKIKATVFGEGDYSFVFNKKQDEALTLFVAPKDSKDNYLSDGEVQRTVAEIEPGDYYGDNNLVLANTNTVYFFKKGNYQIGSIIIPTYSVLYFEEGCYLSLYPDGQIPIYAGLDSHIGIYGHGLIDFSPCNGSQLNAPKDTRAGKTGLNITNCEKVEIKGLMMINSPTWQCCLNCVRDIHIQYCMFYGYRTYSDGVMLNNCQNAVVEQNFIRTGDDAFETKSTSGDMLTKNVVFQHNSAWTDKAVAYGCIYESKNDTSDVHFLHNSVGFASSNWSKHLGCAVIQMGNNPAATMHDIEFDDMEIYYSINQAMCNIYIGGSGGMGAGSGTVKDIYFKNIKCITNYGYMLNLRTYDDENCFIKKVFMENIVSNDIKLTTANYKEYCCIDQVVGGYNVSNLTIDGAKCSK